MVHGGSALGGPAAPRVRAPGPSRALEATPGLRVRTWTLVCVLWVLLEPATGARAYSPDDLRKMELRLSEGWCPAGYYRTETGACEMCQEGVDYTNHSNNLSSCIPCSVCRNDKEQKGPCTTTRDAECQCKPGTFQDQNSPEFCRTCSDRCHGEMVEESPCVPWSDRKCVHKESGTKAIRESPASAEPVTANGSTPAYVHPSSDGTVTYVLLGVFLPVGAVVILLLCITWRFLRRNKIFTCIKNIFPSHGQDSQHMDTVSVPREREAQDNDHNEILASTNSPSTLDSEQPRNGQQLVTRVTEEFPEEETSLLRPAETERSPMRRRPLVPVEGTDTIKTIRQFFSCHQNVVPYKSWDKLMRVLDLTDNEILMIKDRIGNPEDCLYEMMVKWLNKMGHSASINTVLDALETIGERNAREKIEDYMVNSGKFIYQEDGADPARSLL
ncbi:tumor necrosis factor receptor superfamily member 10A isoform X2 [Ictidomys tridecemlineatus]|uniref:Tumor necrosis factor receptor superfamily member 10A n=1 Tax=Ictidomys tridecemlineatus TaxID=43179 RepID=I3N0R0_ICTTR|nr:tumor necrosis factor receptor superfamily member 10A isoform X2 [Ictidomys tridecemlineatus]KAG3294373.1 tumor necrosis factor receptor superfamily member 10A, transcript variant X1 [Ictidomys tridecemlineatus]